MLDFLNDIDTQIFLFFNGAHSPFFDVFMKLFTGKYIWIPMYLAIMLMIWRTAGKHKFIFYLMGVILAVAITDQVCATLIRPAVERLRPSNLQNELSQLTYIVGEYRGGRYGFPSCHAANSFAMATFMAMLVRKRSFVAFIICWAVLNSYSRLYLGVHYPGDLFVGSLIGIVTGIGCFAIVHHLADRATSPKLLTERADRPLISYQIPEYQGFAVILRRGALVTAQGLVKFVGASTVVYIIVRSIIG